MTRQDFDPKASLDEYLPRPETYTGDEDLDDEDHCFFEEEDCGAYKYRGWLIFDYYEEEIVYKSPEGKEFSYKYEGTVENAVTEVSRQIDEILFNQRVCPGQLSLWESSHD